MGAYMYNPLNSEVRIVVQQPALPKYRIPVFKEWASRSGICLTVSYAASDSTLHNESPDGFTAQFCTLRKIKMGKRRLMWHSAQWNSAKRDACDVLVLSWDVQYLSLIPSLIRARLNGIKTILWGHGYSKREFRLRKCIRDSVGRMADALVFYDHITAQRFIEDGWDKKRIHVAPNSLDQTEIQAARSAWLETPAKLKSFQDENGLTGKKNIIYIGRVYKENRLDLLVSALSQITKKYSDIQLLIIGKENDCVAQLKQQATELGVERFIRWLGPIYEESEIAPYMLSSKLFCYPANIGLSIMHAMGYGVPVITGDDIAAHNPEIHVLEDGVNGCLFKDSDVSDLADKIMYLLSSENELDSLGKTAREAVLNGFTTNDMVDGFMSAVRSVINES